MLPACQIGQLRFWRMSKETWCSWYVRRGAYQPPAPRSSRLCTLDRALHWVIYQRRRLSRAPWALGRPATIVLPNVQY